jgi:hypothetical protein
MTRYIINSLQGLEKKISQVEEKQILFCTLYPFKTFSDSFVGEELTNIAINWRSREVRATSPNRVFPVTFSFEDCNDIEWTALHNIRYCSMSVLLNRLEEPCGIRLYLMQSALSDLLAAGYTCAQFMAFETLLAACLKDFSYADGSEKGSTKRKKHSQECDQQIDVPMCTQIANGFFWDYESKTFTDTAAQACQFTLRPSFLVSSLISGWQETVLQCVYSSTRKSDLVYRANGLLMPNCTLVVTKTPDEWSLACKKLDVAHERLEVRGLVPNENVRILIADEETIASGTSNELNFMEVVDFMSTFVMGERSNTQLKRLILDFSRKMKNFHVPLGLLQFGSIVIEDDCFGAKNLLPETSTPKWIHVFKDNSRATPTHLSKKQLSLLGANSVCLPRLKLDNYITVVPISRSIIRRIRIFGKPIKNGLVETRIASFFQQKFCPIPFRDALERFSGRAMPPDVAKGLMKRHFDSCEVTLADFSSTDSSKITQNFLMQSLDGPKACTICFEDLDNLFGLSLCGHVYCAECILRHFQASWTLSEAKECAACRTRLFSGDLFHIDPGLEDYAPSLPCKQAAIKDFVASYKSSTSVWPDISAKLVIVDDLETCTVASLIQSLRDHKTAVNVHIFYLPHQAALFKQFSLEFV